MKHIYKDRDDGLALCTVCHGGECELPTDCPGVAMTYEERSAVCDGALDFVNGKWMTPGSQAWKEAHK